METNVAVYMRLVDGESPLVMLYSTWQVLPSSLDVLSSKTQAHRKFADEWKMLMVLDNMTWRRLGKVATLFSQAFDELRWRE